MIGFSVSFLVGLSVGLGVEMIARGAVVGLGVRGPRVGRILVIGTRVGLIVGLSVETTVVAVVERVGDGVNILVSMPESGSASMISSIKITNSSSFASLSFSSF